MQGPVPNTSENARLVNNLEGFKSLSISNSPMKLSFSPGLSPNAVDSTLSNFTKESMEQNTNTVPFKSLADLTAHHLQKSSSLLGSRNTNEKTLSCGTNFVIPKLSLKKDNCNDQSNVDLSATQRNINIGSDTLNDKTKVDPNSMDSLERHISHVLALSRNYTNPDSIDISQKVESKEDSLLNVSGTRTPSPDLWMIDLSSALKEATAIIPNNPISSHTKAKVIGITDTISKLNIHISDHNTPIPYNILPTTLNLSPLKHVKLPYAKKNVSLFGRTLCKTWKLRKPNLKSQKQQYETVRRFDFSVPYSRA